MFAVGCLYPFIYTISSAISGYVEVRDSTIILFPKNVQFDAFKDVFNDNVFWNAYTNTLFLTFYGTIWEMMLSVFGAYALSKKRLLFRKGFNFFLVFTMWFSAGMVPQYLNYLATKRVFQDVGIMDDKWLVVIAMGMQAMKSTSPMTAVSCTTTTTRHRQLTTQLHLTMLPARSTWQLWFLLQSGMTVPKST